MKASYSLHDLKQRMASLQQNQLALVVNSLLGILVLIAFLHAVFSLPALPPNALAHTNMNHPVEQVSADRAISNAHLFGVAVADTNLAKTNLNVRLAGVFVTNHPGDSRAAISVAGANSKLFKVGDNIMPGVTLDQVFNKRIYLNNQGRLEQLDLPRSDVH